MVTMERCGILIFIIQSRTNFVPSPFDGLLETIISLITTRRCLVPGYNGMKLFRGFHSKRFSEHRVMR